MTRHLFLVVVNIFLYNEDSYCGNVWGGMGMKNKIVYYITETILTIIFSTVWHYIMLKNAPIGWDSGSGAFDFMYFLGIIIYCVIIAMLMIFAKKKIDTWKWYDYIITVVVAVACMIAGLFVMVNIFR